MTKVIASNHRSTVKKSSLALEESMVSAEEIGLFEDFEEISRSLTRSRAGDDSVVLTSADALVGWGYDMAERLNSGEVSLQTLAQKFRVDIARADMIQFRQVGDYELRLEREDLNKPWHEHIKHLSPHKPQQGERMVRSSPPHVKRKRPPDH